MVKLIIDDKEIEVPDYYTLLQACEAAGAEIPRFCFHERLSVAGNCRMCLVEVKGGPPKPTASCAFSVRDLRPAPDGSPPVIYTASPMAIKARQGVMEFLLINHPLDCPICDQGGECDLQDQAMAYGVDGSRFHENKRAVEDKYIGPLIKTEMTRCIHCTRCVRFSTEVAGIEEIGAIGRGENLEITTYLEKSLNSELQGNLADICPVGALTSKPYAFTGRPWELTKTESIDVMDALGSAIRIDSRGPEVMRILPRLNEEINEEWIADKTRFVFDGLKLQRLDQPYLRHRGRLIPATWPEVFAEVTDLLKQPSPDQIGVIAGDMVSVEDMYAMKDMLDLLGINNRDCRQDGVTLDPKNGRGSYLFNSTIAGIDRADAILIVGANPRLEAPVMNARILRASRKYGARIAVIGDRADLTYPYTHLGQGVDTLAAMVSGGSGSDKDFYEQLCQANHPLIIIGQGALVGDRGNQILAMIAKLALDVGAVKGDAGANGEDWNGFCVLHTAAARVGGLDIGFVPADGGLATQAILTRAAKGELATLILQEADEVDMSNLKNTKVIYIGSHGDKGAERADVVIPVAAYSEKDATYVNTEGRVQRTQMAVFPPGEARSGWSVLRALSEYLHVKLPYDSLEQLRDDMIAAYPHLGMIDEIAFADNGNDVTKLARQTSDDLPGARGKRLTSTVTDFYFTNPVARSSRVMAKVRALRYANKTEVA